jgi:hypothetical protein
VYRINTQSNRITKVPQVKFSDLGLSERRHLQEWLANQPDALGEDLLIIQKEFDGFDDTRERLDLLAVDKDGALVIIENKLDDSGRDVVWQALKYASYCSTLSKTHIAEMFQKYLDKGGPGKDAKALLCEFLEKEEYGEVDLNAGNDQRVIMVAAEFRKEVTSTALWLLKHRIDVKCFKVSLYQDGKELSLTVDQLIPLPEAAELMIGISEKELEEHTVERGQATRHQLRRDFWQRTLQALEDAGVTLYSNVTPGKDHWLSAGSGLSGVHYTMVLNQDEARVEFVFDGPSKDVNKTLFGELAARSADLEKKFGAPLVWDKLDDKKASIIRYGHEFEGHNRDTWPDVIQWLVEHIRRMEHTFATEVPRLRTAARQEPKSERP